MDLDPKALSAAAAKLASLPAGANALDQAKTAIEAYVAGLSAGSGNARGGAVLFVAPGDEAMIHAAISFQELRERVSGGKSLIGNRAAEIAAAMEPMLPEAAKLFYGSAWSEICLHAAAGENISISLENSGGTWSKPIGQIAVKAGRKEWRTSRRDYGKGAPEMALIEQAIEPFKQMKE